MWWTQEYEPPHDKTNKMASAPSEDSDQPGHPPSLIIVFAVRMKKAWVLSYPFSAQRRLWSDWADAQADLSLRWGAVILLVLSWGSSHIHVLNCARAQMWTYTKKFEEFTLKKLLSSKDVDGMSNSVVPDCRSSLIFAQTCLSGKLGSLR